jgi:hypothetical protein
MIMLWKLLATLWHYLVIVLATTINNEICVTLISTLFIGIANRYFLCYIYIKEKEQNQKINPNSCEEILQNND